MTSKISFSADRGAAGHRLPAAGFLTRQRSLAGRRLWPIALTFLSFLLCHALGTVTALHSVTERAEYARYTSVEKAQALREAVSAILGRGSFSWIMLALPCAAILAIEGFLWMDDRRQVDFYESLPVPRWQRFADICIGSILYFVFSYVITLEIGLAAAGAMGALSRALLLEVMWTAAKTIAFFLAVYALGVLSVMLTGNGLIAWLAFLVLLFYESILRLVLLGYCSQFLTCWAENPGTFSTDAVLSPFSYYESGSAPACVIRLLLLASLYFGLACVCYRLRRNEYAGTAVVFGPVRSVVRVAMAVLAGLIVGLFWLSIDSGRNIAIPLLWTVTFTVIAACIMQIIYEYDFRALFQRPLEIAAAVLLTLLICLGFYYDLGGYDRYTPDPDKVADASLSLQGSFDMTIDETGHIISPEQFGSLYMHLDNVEDVIALAQTGQEYTRRARKAGQEEDAAVEYRFTVEYRMKNGRTVKRRFSVPADVEPAMMDAVTGTQNFREGTFFLYHDNALRFQADNLAADYTNGKTWGNTRLNTASYEAFRKAYMLDLAQFSYSFCRGNKPVGRLTLSYDAQHAGSPGGELADLEYISLSCPVYPTFTHTVAWLQENGIWTESLDFASLPSYEDPDLSREDQEYLDSIDWTVFNGPFSQ